jgi:phosphopantothenoylcysteine decarboxylase/phosphopantothenate--cysteine ligase
LDLNNKRVLITAGPTSVAIDGVRVISNIATGQTGILLAKELNQAGAKVTLVLGPAAECVPKGKINIIRFRFFEELRQAVKKELKQRHYDIIVHSAAVSDFKPKRFIKGKLESEKSRVLELSVLPKIVKEIRRAAPSAELVMFKLEPCAADAELMRRARNALSEAGADLIVANRISPRYRAYILDKHTKYAQANSRQALARGLVRVLRDFKGR